MHRIEGSDVDTSTGVNLFKTTPPLTVMTPEWTNATQEEIMYVVEQSGLPVLGQANDTRTQLWEAIRRIAQNWDYIVDSQATFVAAFTRVAANQYKINDDYKSIYFKIIAGGYSMANVLAGGDTWGYIETNNCTHVEFENGAYIDMENERGYIEVDTDTCLLRNVDIRGANSVASAIAQSFLLNASYVTFDNCRTSARLSNVAFAGFRGSGTALHNKTSKYINCSAYNLTTSNTVYGFYLCQNGANSLCYDLESTGGVANSFSSCVNFVNNFVNKIDGVTFAQGIADGINIVNSYIEDIDASGGLARGLSGGDCYSNVYLFDLQSSVNQTVYGILNCDNISSAKIQQLDTTGTGVVYGISGCNQVSSVEIVDLDGANEVYGVNASYQISSCYINDLQSSGNNSVVGFLSSENISSCKVNQLDAAGTGDPYGLHTCNQVSSVEITDLDGADDIFGVWNSGQLSSIKIDDLDSSGGIVYGIKDSDQISSSYVFDLLSPVNQDVYGMNTVNNISSCKINQLDTSGTGILYGIRDSFQVSACEIIDLDGAAAVYGIDDTDQLTGCKIDDCQSTGGALYGINDSINIAGCAVSNLTGADGSQVYGYFTCQTVAACDARIIDSTNADAYAFRSVSRSAALYCFNIDETGASDAHGFRDCVQITGCFASDVDSSAGNAYGYYNCDYGAALSMDEVVNPNNDFIDTTDAAIVNQFSCHATNWT